MPEAGDWSRCSFEGNRHAQHVEFMALSFREKLIRLEQMADVQRVFARSASHRQGSGPDGSRNGSGRLPSR